MRLKKGDGKGGKFNASRHTDRNEQQLPQCDGAAMISGGFWPNEAWNTGSRYIVLNEPMAFRLFGGGDITGNTVEIDGAIYLVTGVVLDGKKKEPAAYVPSSVLHESPEVLMVKTGEGSGAMISSLRRLGIYETNSRVIDVYAVSQIFWQLSLVSVCFIIALSVTLFIRSKLKELGILYNVLKQRYQTMYPAELIRESRRELKRIASLGSTVILGTTFLLLLARQILWMALGWKETMDDIKYLSDYFFQDKMQWLMRYLISGPVLFLVFMTAVFLMLALNYFDRSSRGRTY